MVKKYKITLRALTIIKRVTIIGILFLVMGVITSIDNKVQRKSNYVIPFYRHNDPVTNTKLFQVILYEPYKVVEDYFIDLIKDARRNGFFIYYPSIVHITNGKYSNYNNVYKIVFFSEPDEDLTKWIPGYDTGKNHQIWARDTLKNPLNRLEKEAYRGIR